MLGANEAVPVSLARTGEQAEKLRALELKQKQQQEQLNGNDNDDDDDIDDDRGYPNNSNDIDCDQSDNSAAMANNARGASVDIASSPPLARLAAVLESAPARRPSRPPTAREETMLRDAGLWHLLLEPATPVYLGAQLLPGFHAQDAGNNGADGVTNTASAVNSDGSGGSGGGLVAASASTDKEWWSVGEVLELMRRAYTGRTGVEYVHLADRAQGLWVRDQAEADAYYAMMRQNYLYLTETLTPQSNATASPNGHSASSAPSGRFGVGASAAVARRALAPSTLAPAFAHFAHTHGIKKESQSNPDAATAATKSTANSKSIDGTKDGDAKAAASAASADHAEDSAAASATPAALTHGGAFTRSISSMAFLASRAEAESPASFLTRALRSIAGLPSLIALLPQPTAPPLQPHSQSPAQPQSPDYSASQSPTSAQSGVNASPTVSGSGTVRKPPPPSLAPSASDRLALLSALATAEAFETALQTSYPGAKRFSLEGAEALVPLVQVLLSASAIGSPAPCINNSNAGNSSDFTSSSASESSVLGASITNAPHTARVGEVVFGMAHRGRLALLACVMGKASEVFAQFISGARAPSVTNSGATANNTDADGNALGPSASTSSVNEAGDVKYHLGAQTTVWVPIPSNNNANSSGSTTAAPDSECADEACTATVPLKLSLVPNPSHLELVGPVVAGVVRARHTYRPYIDKHSVFATADVNASVGDNSGGSGPVAAGAGSVSSLPLSDSGSTPATEPGAGVLAIVLHGDGSFAGQGLVSETLGLTELAPYAADGAIHIVVNNQIAFTTPPHHGRTSLHPTDVARVVGAPILHVNADDVDSVYRVARQAAAFRARFKRSVIIDLVCYRRRGHNEQDDPSFTQPERHAALARHPAAAIAYARRLVRDGVCTPEDVIAIGERARAAVAAAHEAARASVDADSAAPADATDTTVADERKGAAENNNAATKENANGCANTSEVPLTRAVADATGVSLAPSTFLAQRLSYQPRFDTFGKRLSSGDSQLSTAVAILEHVLACSRGRSAPRTGLQRSEALAVAEDLCTAPSGGHFRLHPGELTVLQQRRRMLVDCARPVSWAAAEALALGAVVRAGAHVRLTGQDVERGTFSQRHAVVVNQDCEAEKVTLLHGVRTLPAPAAARRDLAGRAAPAPVIANSPLSEAAALGFEYGYDLAAAPRQRLVLWEAQFGDFANCAQTVIDCYLAAGAAKWGARSGLVVLLPHGLEGQGPDHSSARPERLLQLVDEPVYTLDADSNGSSEVSLDDVSVLVENAAIESLRNLRFSLGLNITAGDRVAADGLRVLLREGRRRARLNSPLSVAAASATEAAPGLELGLGLSSGPFERASLGAQRDINAGVLGLGFRLNSNSSDATTTNASMNAGNTVNSSSENTNCDSEGICDEDIDTLMALLSNNNTTVDDYGAPSYCDMAWRRAARSLRAYTAAQAVNIAVASPSTPAQYFHLLRRQAAAPTGPLFVLTPKSLLHDRACVSEMAAMGPGTAFEPVLVERRGASISADALCDGVGLLTAEELQSIESENVGDDAGTGSGGRSDAGADDGTAVAKAAVVAVRGATHVWFCTGKAYYSLVLPALASLANSTVSKNPSRTAAADVLVVRLEQLSPFPTESVVALLAAAGPQARVRWVQEEPANQGCWGYVQPRLDALLRVQRSAQVFLSDDAALDSSGDIRHVCARAGGVRVAYTGRPAAAAAAGGSMAQHKAEEEAMRSMLVRSVLEHKYVFPSD